jgi:imidazoleglycerol-phosphate dehydratase
VTGPEPGHRRASVSLATGETSVEVTVDLDRPEPGEIATGVAFFDHMVGQLGRHGRLGLWVATSGDLDVDAHHTVEDTGIALGQALAQALGDKAGIERFGDATVPLDEACVRVAVDLSGRGYVVYDAETPIEMIGTYETSLTRHFLEAVTANAELALHATKLSGDNTHHVHEAVFKATAVALRRALALTRAGGVPSTKGVL